MNETVNWLRMITAPMLLAAVTGSAATGCGDDRMPIIDEGDCGPVLGRVEGFQTSVLALVTAVSETKGKLATACATIAGETPPTAGVDVRDADVTSLCEAASAEITAQFSAAGAVYVSAAPAECMVNVAAQFECEANCSETAECECDPGTVEARCPPGELSGDCTGSCTGTCRAKAGATVTCNAACDGTCRGSCAGACSAQNVDGSCNGSCEGTCNGACSGGCTIEASGGAHCEDTCKGECSVDFTAPSCEAQLEPPSCDCEAAADCNANCSGLAALDANCTPPSIEIVAEGTLDATFLANFEAGFPVVLEVMGRLELVGDGMGRVVDEGAGLVGALSSTCVGTWAGELQAQVEATVAAATSVNVSIDASADVSGSVAAGG